MHANHDLTPGPLKVALSVWMILIAGLLGYSIAGAEDTEAPAHVTVSPGGVHDPSSPPRAATRPGATRRPASAAPTSAASVVAPVLWRSCTALPGIHVGYPGGRLEPAADDCARLRDARKPGGRIAVLFQMEDMAFDDKMDEVRRENNPDVVEPLATRTVNGRRAGVITYRRDASTFVTCPGASIEYVYFVDAPQAETLDAVFFSCEDEAQAMRSIYDGIMQRLRFD